MPQTAELQTPRLGQVIAFVSLSHISRRLNTKLKAASWSLLCSFLYVKWAYYIKSRHVLVKIAQKPTLSVFICPNLCILVFAEAHSQERQARQMFGAPQKIMKKGPLMTTYTDKFCRQL